MMDRSEELVGRFKRLGESCRLGCFFFWKNREKKNRELLGPNGWFRLTTEPIF